MINGDDFRIVQSVNDLVVNYQFVEAGTTIPVAGNWRERIGDLDNDNDEQLRISADALVFNTPTNISTSESNGVITLVTWTIYQLGYITQLLFQRILGP